MTVQPEFDEYADNYQQKIEEKLRFAGQGHDFFVQDKLRHVGRLLSRLAPATSSLKVLDVGCGVGVGHDRLAPTVGELHGVDVSSLSIERARTTNPQVNYQVYDGHRLPYADGSLDFTYAVCVMHHVPKIQWPAFLSEMKRVLRVGGRLAIIEHNPLHPGTQWVVRTCELDKDAVLLFPWGLRGLMSRCGLCEIQVAYTLFTPFSHPFFRRLEDALRWLPLGAQYVMAADKQ